MQLPVKTIIALLALTYSSIAQPVINSNSMPPIGFATTMYVGTNITSAGSGGVNAYWDFSFQSSFNFVGNLEYIGIQGTEFEADYPTCNLVERRRIGSDTIYTYMTDFGSFVEIYAENMGSAFPLDYSINKKLLFNFPMNYGDSLVDTWQRVGSQGRVRRYYDGYGTLNTLFFEFHNVARIKTVDSVLVGSAWSVNTSYTWYTTDKLLPVARFDNNSQQMIILKTFPLSVSNTSIANNSVSIAPNPFRENARLHTDTFVPGMQLVITNALGQVVRLSDVTSPTTVINRDGLTAGIYLYRLQGKEGIAAQGKLVIE